MNRSVSFSKRSLAAVLAALLLLLLALAVGGGRSDDERSLALLSRLQIPLLDRGSLTRLIQLPAPEAVRKAAAALQGPNPVDRLELPPGYTSTSSGGRMIFAHFGDGEIPALRQAMQTSFTLANDSDYDAQGTLSFFRDDGSAETVTIGGTKASSFPVTIHRGETVKLVTSAKGTLRSGWALLETDQPVTGSSAFSMKNGTGHVLAEVGVSESTLGTEFTLFADTIGAANTGVAMVNPSPSAALAVDLELHGVGGGLIRTERVNVPPHGHVARFINELFKSVGGIQEFEGSVVLKGNQPFGGLTLRTLGSLMTSVPLVPPLNEFDYGAQLLFPQVADGAQGNTKILTTVVLFNNSTLPSTGQVEFFQSDGAPMTVNIGGTKAATFAVNLGPGAVQRLVTTPATGIRTGWARVQTDQPLHGASMFHIQNAAGQTLSEVGVPSGRNLDAFNVLADSTGPYRTAVAVMNPSESGDTAAVTFRLFNSSGDQLAQEARDLPPLTNSSFFVDELFSNVPGIKEMRGRVGVTSDELVVAMTLQQIDLLTTSAPIVVPQHGFAPKSVLEFPQNLTGTAPSVRWRIEQSATDLTVEMMEVKAPQLGVNGAGIQAGDVIGQGYYLIDLGPAQLGGIVQLVSTGGKTFDALASGQSIPPGLPLLSGSFAGTPTGGLILRLDPTGNRNGNWNDRRRLEMDMQLMPGLITTPAAAGTITITTHSTSASSKLDDLVRITCNASQPQAFVKPGAASLQLHSQTPVYFGGGRNLVVLGQGFDSSVEVGFPTADGTSWRPPWETTATELNIPVPANAIEGELLVRKGAQQSNPLLMRSLFTPTVQVTRSGGVRAATTLAPRFDFVVPARQMAIQAFQVRLLDCDRNLGSLSPGAQVGSASVAAGLQDGARDTYEVRVDSAAAGQATLNLVRAGGGSPKAVITVTPLTEDQTKSITFDFAFTSPATTPVVNAYSSGITVDLSGLLLTLSDGVSDPLWSAEVSSTPAELSGSDDGIQVQTVMSAVQ